MRSLVDAGFNPKLCLQAMTDGATAAQNEGRKVIDDLHELACRKVAAAAAAERAAAAAAAAAARAGAPAAVQQQPPAPRMSHRQPLLLSTSETCAIHGKALEERALLDESFPLLVDALRIIWDIMKGENGRVW